MMNYLKLQGLLLQAIQLDAQIHALEKVIDMQNADIQSDIVRFLADKKMMLRGFDSAIKQHCEQSC